MFGMGSQELLLILVIVLVLFGGSKLPDLAKSLGKSMKEFKKGIGAEAEAEQTPDSPGNPWLQVDRLDQHTAVLRRIDE